MNPTATGAGEQPGRGVRAGRGDSVRHEFAHLGDERAGYYCCGYPVCAIRHAQRVCDERQVSESAAGSLRWLGERHETGPAPQTRASSGERRERDLANAHLGEAKQTAQRLGAAWDDYQLCFGPTNVNIWSVGLAVEILDGAEAVKRSQKFTIPATAQRKCGGHHWIDFA